MSAGPSLHAATPALGSVLLLLARWLLLGASYFLTGWLALRQPAVAPYVSLFWLPAGIALAALLRWGWRMAPAIVCAAAMLDLQLSASLPQALLMACGNVAGPALAAALMRRSGFSTPLHGRRDMYLLLTLGLVLGPALSASWGTAMLSLFAQLQPDELMPAWLCWWGGDGIGVLLAAVPLLSWPAAGTARITGANPGPAPRLGLALTAVALLASAGMAFAADPRTGPSPWLFAPHLLMLILSMRASLGLASTMALLLALLAGVAESAGLGPFASTPAPGHLALLWGYLGSLAALPLLTQALNAELDEDRRHWRSALRSCGLALAEWDASTGRQLRSVEWHSLLGPPDPACAGPTDWLESAHPLERDPLRQAVDELVSSPQRAELHTELRLPGEGAGESDGWRWHELHLLVQQRDRQGMATRLLTILRDVDWRRTAEERQRMSASLFQHLHEGLLVTDPEHRVLQANPSYCRILGQTPESISGVTAVPLQDQHLRRSGHDPAALRQQLHQDGHWQATVDCSATDGSRRRLQLTVSTIPEPVGPPRFHVVAVSDLTAQHDQRALLEHQSRFDTLTGLPNPVEFKSLLEQGRRAAELGGFSLCLCWLDLDDFKRINTQHGRATGDWLLQETARRLTAALRSAPEWSDAAARLGGDEFGLLLRCRGMDEARQAVERMLNVLRAPFDAAPNGEALSLTASLGATLYPQDGSDAETLLRHASHALYRIKRAGRNHHEFFDNEKRIRREARALSLWRLQQALDAGELLLHFQPKVDMRRQRVLGMEALLRWQHPERGLIGPSEFLSALEDTGLATQVGDWVIAQALSQSARWLAAGLRLSVSVNVAARHLQGPDFLQRLRELLSRHAEPVAPHLMLEVLESAALADIGTTQLLIQRCQALGVRFALDDFGTGYSSLTYLKRLPVDALKIDRSFVQGMLSDAQDLALVEGVIRLARSFGCELIAEGVETRAHGEALLAHGCDIGQGNGIAPAMPASEVADWVEQFERAPQASAEKASGPPIH